MIVDITVGPIYIYKFINLKKRRNLNMVDFTMYICNESCNRRC